MDAKGNELSEQVPFDTFNRQLSPINRHMASKVASSVQDQIHALIESAEQAVLPKLDEVRQTAKSEMQQKLNSELERLLALKAVNPNIRDEEISAIETQIETLSGYIETAQLQLDSLRLIVVAHQ